MAGELVPFGAKTKLTDADVAEIRRRYAAGGVRMRALGAEYGVDHSHISDIVNGHRWPP